MVRGLLIPSGEDPIEERTVASLPDYREAVGGWIEAIDLPDVGITIYVNEEGLLRQLPFNPRATFLWWYHQAEARQQTMLVGNALVVGLPDRSGESTDVPDAVAELFLRPGLWRVEVQTTDGRIWFRNQMTYQDYWKALIGAMVTLERWKPAIDVRIVPVPWDEAIGLPNSRPKL